MSKRGEIEAVDRFAARSAIVHPNAATTTGLASLYLAQFEPGEYLLRQIVLDLVGICLIWHAIYEGREFIVHCAKGWHLREQDRLGQERQNEREIQRHVQLSYESSIIKISSLIARTIKNQHTRECLVQKQIDLRTQFRRILIQENPNVGVAVTPCSRETIEPIPTIKPTFKNATRGTPFAHASSSNTGSIILHGAYVTDVNITTTAQCEPSRLRNDPGSVDRWMVAVVVGLFPRALVNGEGVL